MIRLFFLGTVFFLIISGCGRFHYATPGSDLNKVSLLLSYPDAGRVEFASSMDNFEIHKVNKNVLGFWEIVLPLRAEFRYFYLVDGSFYIPDCPNRETDDFGSQNCIYIPEKL